MLYRLKNSKEWYALGAFFGFTTGGLGLSYFDLAGVSSFFVGTVVGAGCLNEIIMLVRKEERKKLDAIQ